MLVQSTYTTNDELYSQIAELQDNVLKHCNMQLWYPGPESEDNLCINDEIHGVAITGLRFDIPPTKFLAQIFEECDQTNHFEDLSAVKNGWWPLVLVACRHYRLPPPLYFLKDIYRYTLQESELA